MKFVKASFWKRLISFLLDILLMTIVIGLIDNIFKLNDIVEYWVYFGIFYGYNILMDYYLQGTLGKMILKLKVIKTDGQRPNLLNSFYRNFGKNISILPFGYGYLRILAPHQKQTMHDELGNCLIIDSGRKIKNNK